MSKTLFLDYEIKPISFEVINPEFTKMRCWIMALGKNRNYSYFTKESVESALPSLYNIPVVAHIKKRSDGGWYVGSHDRQIVIDDDGITVNDLTLPFGLVPESCNPTFEEVIESDGTKVTYLVADILLWTGRYPDILDAKSQTDNQTYYNQSMEISVSAWQELQEDKKYSDITQFNFSALCLLGRDLENPEYHSEPCFPSARVEPYQYSFGDKFKFELSLMIKELNKFNFNNDNHLNKEKEDKILNEKLELLAKYNLTIEQLNFSIEDFALEDLEKKLKEFSVKSEEVPDTKTSFSATYNQKREAIRNALDSVYVKNEDGDIVESTYYYLMDFSDEYVFVEKDHWTEDGNFEETHGRLPYSFDEATMTATITGEWVDMFLMWLTADEKQSLETMRNEFETIKSDFDAYKETYKTSEIDVEDLRKFKADVIAEKRKQDEEAIFSMKEFKDIVNNKDFKALKEKAGDYDLDTLTEKCFSILGKTSVNFSVNTPVKKETVKVNIDVVNPDADDSYGGLFAMYSNKNK